MVRPQRAIDSHKRPRVSPFVKLEINPPLLYYLSDSITNNNIKVRSSMINNILWMDSRMCQKSPLVTAGKA